MILDIIKQNIVEHPEWGESEHHHDLIQRGHRNVQLGLNVLGHPNAADVADEQCKFPQGCDNERIFAGQLCFHHTVSVGRLFAPSNGGQW